jgi:hypothetical protein
MRTKLPALLALWLALPAAAIERAVDVVPAAPVAPATGRGVALPAPAVGLDARALPQGVEHGVLPAAVPAAAIAVDVNALPQGIEQGALPLAVPAAVAQSKPAQAAESQAAQSSVVFDQARWLSPAQSLDWLSGVGRNWYYNAVAAEPEARAQLSERLSRSPSPERLAARLSADAAKHGVSISRVVSVYRYGSSVWGHKSQSPQDFDLLVVVDGQGAASKQTPESVSWVDPEKPGSFLIYLNEEEAPKGELPLNVTVVSREYIAGFQARRGVPEELRALDIGSLWGDHGHGVLVYGDDALTALSPRPADTAYGASREVVNAGGFMENFIFHADMRKAQALSTVAHGRVSDEENNKLIPKIHLRYLEAKLRLAAAMTALGREAASVSPALGTAASAYSRYFLGRDWPSLKVEPKLVSATIDMHNSMSRIVDKVWDAMKTPEERRRERVRSIVTAILMAVLLAAGFATFAFAGLLR